MQIDQWEYMISAALFFHPSYAVNGHEEHSLLIMKRFIINDVLLCYMKGKAY